MCFCIFADHIIYSMGTVSFDDFMVERPPITATILEFIDNLENKA